MSCFSVGGNAGYAVGVLLAAPVLVSVGRTGIAWLAVLGLASGLLTLASSPAPRQPPPLAP